MVMSPLKDSHFKWYNFNNKKPYHGKHVLICFIKSPSDNHLNKETDRYFYYVARYNDKTYSGENYFEILCNKTYGHINLRLEELPSHWCELPDSPKYKEEKI